MAGSCSSTVGVAVSVAVLREGRGCDLLVNGGNGVAFLQVMLADPWLPVGSWATKENLPGHLVRRNVALRPQAASAASESLCTLAAKLNPKR